MTDLTQKFTQNLFVRVALIALIIFAIQLTCSGFSIAHMNIFSVFEDMVIITSVMFFSRFAQRRILYQ